VPARALSFDISMQVIPMFKFSASTIWPAINHLESEVEELQSADDRLIAALENLKGKTP